MEWTEIVLLVVLTNALGFAAGSLIALLIRLGRRNIMRFFEQLAPKKGLFTRSMYIGPLYIWLFNKDSLERLGDRRVKILFSGTIGIGRLRFGIDKDWKA